MATLRQPRSSWSQRGALLLPAGVLALGRRATIQHVRFDLVDERHGLALGRNQVVPTAGHHLRGLKAENAIGERIAAVMIEEKPAVEAFGAQRLLNFGRSHGH